jgi:hypothetical protein
VLIDFQLSQTSIVLRLKLRQDTTGAAPGKGMTGLTSASVGLIIAAAADNEATTTAYTSAGSTIESITTLGTFATPTATKCRFKEYDATNHKGVYEVQLDNTRYAVASSKSLLISISGVSGMADCDVVIPLRSVNPYDGVYGGMSALPNTACTTNASLITSGTGTDQLQVSAGIATANVSKWAGTLIPAPSQTGVPITDPHYWNGTAFVSVATAGIPDVNVKNWANVVVTGMPMPTYTQPTGFLAEDFGELDADIEAIQTGVAAIPTSNPSAAAIATAVWQDATAGDFTIASSIGKSLYTAGVVPGAAGGVFIAGANAATTVNITGNITGNLVGTVSTLTTYTGNTPQTGDSFARLGAPANASVSADIAELDGFLDTLLTSVTVGGYSAGQDPWSIIKASVPSAAPTAGQVEWLLRLLDADLYVDTTVTPWAIVYMVRNSGGIGVGTELHRKKLTDTAGANLVANTTIVGNAHQ